MINANTAVHTIDSWLGKGLGLLSGLKNSGTARAVVDSTRGLGAAAKASARGVGRDILARSGVNSWKGYGLVGLGVTGGAGAGVYNDPRHPISAGLKGGLIGGGLVGGGLLGGGLYKSARYGSLGTDAKSAWGATAGVRDRVKTGIQSRWNTMAERGSQMSFDFSGKVPPTSAQGSLF